MPPNFEEVEGHIGPGSSVRPFVRASVLNAFHILRAMHDRVLKFHIWWIRHQKLADPYFLFFFFFFPCPSCFAFWSYIPLEKIIMKSCQQDIRKQQIQR